MPRRKTPAARNVLLATLSEREQEEAEQRFFASFRLENGTLKLTTAGRLDDLNAMILRHLPRSQPIRAMDVGISSGITTLEWADNLRTAGIELELFGGDLTAHALLWSFGGVLHVLTEESGHPLQYECGGFVLAHAPRWREKVALFPATLISAGVMRWLARRRLHFEGITAERVPLVSPRLAARRDIVILDDDVFAPWARPERFDVVRVANVLNPAYFSRARLAEGLSCLRLRLAPGGLLALCRSEGRDGQTKNHATLFGLKANGGLSPVERLHGGSELEHLAVDLR